MNIFSSEQQTYNVGATVFALKIINALNNKAGVLVLIIETFILQTYLCDENL